MAQQITKPQVEYKILGKVFFEGNSRQYSHLFPPSMCADKIEDADVFIKENTTTLTQEKFTGARIKKVNALLYTVPIYHVLTHELIGSAGYFEGGIYGSSGFSMDIESVLRSFIASTPCPACGKSFYLSDSTCPSCGHMLPESELLSARKTVQEQNRLFFMEKYRKQNGKHKMYTAILAILLSGGGIALLIGILLNLQRNSSSNCVIVIGVLSVVFGLISIYDFVRSKKRLENFKKALS